MTQFANHIGSVADQEIEFKSNYQVKREKACRRGGVLLMVLVSVILLARSDALFAQELDDENYLPSPAFIDETQPWVGKVRTIEQENKVRFIIDADDDTGVTYTEVFVGDEFYDRILQKPYDIYIPKHDLNNQPVSVRVFDAAANQAQVSVSYKPHLRVAGGM